MARFDGWARVYDAIPVPTHARLVRSALGAVRGPLLDLGGGTAKQTKRFAPRLDAVVVDASRGMLLRARRTGRRVHLAHALAQRLPLRDASVGAVVCTEAFHHFGPHQDDVLAEIHRVLSPGGRLVIEEIDPTRVLGRGVVLLERVLRFGSRFHPPAPLTERLAQRFVGVRATRSGAYAYLVVADKPDPIPARDARAIP